MSPAITLVLALIVLWALVTGRLYAIWQGIVKPAVAA